MNSNKLNAIRAFLDYKYQSEYSKKHKDNPVRCTRCVYDQWTPGITFDKFGVCNYCHLYDALEKEYPAGIKGRNILHDLVDKIKSAGSKNKYDVVIGISGGCDSSFLLYSMAQYNLRILAVNYDNGWASPIANENIQKMTDSLNVDFYINRPDRKEINAIYRAFMLSGVAEIDAISDIGLLTTLYRAAARYNVKYIFDGHSFRTEGIAPLNWCYFDGMYIHDIVKNYGNNLQLKTFPNLYLREFLNYLTIKPIKRLRPLYYINYEKEKVKQYLNEKYGWKWYGGHHYENKMTYFNHAIIFPHRLGIDQKINGYSALVRSGQLERDKAINLCAEPPLIDLDIIGEILDGLKITPDEFIKLMKMPVKNYRQFKTYKKTFEKLKWFFWLMYKAERVPKSFYLKYCN